MDRESVKFFRGGWVGGVEFLIRWVKPRIPHLRRLDRKRELYLHAMPSLLTRAQMNLKGCTYKGVPTRVYLQGSTYKGLPTRVYLQGSTYKGLPTRVYLQSYLALTLSWSGFDRYKGGLDTVHDLTGTHSIFTHWRGIEIMFHVSTMLPFEMNDPQKVSQSGFRIRARNVSDSTLSVS